MVAPVSSRLSQIFRSIDGVVNSLFRSSESFTHMCGSRNWRIQRMPLRDRLHVKTLLAKTIARGAGGTSLPISMRLEVERDLDSVGWAPSSSCPHIAQASPSRRFPTMDNDIHFRNPTRCCERGRIYEVDGMLLTNQDGWVKHAQQQEIQW